MKENTIQAGALLVAHPGLNDPVFGKSVILVLVHGGDGGTIGVNLAGETACEGKVIHGGPMAAPEPLLLHNGAAHESSKPVGATGYAVAALYADEAGKMQPADLLERKPSKMIVVDGYGGWEAGQLAAEAAMGAWIPARVSLDALLSVPAEQRWAAAAASAGLVAPAPAPKPPGENGPK